MKFFENENRLIVVLILFSAFLFLIGLGAMPLTDPDESFYAETAREMLNRHEFLTPYIFGEPQFEKPPLYYWAVIFGFMIFGIGEFSARFGSAVFGILGVIGVYFLGKILVNKRTGFFAGITLATSVMYLALSRACVTDIALCVFMLYAFLFFFYGYFTENARPGRAKWFLLSAVFLGLAVLTKGPVALFLPFVIVGIYLAITKSRGGLNLRYLLYSAIAFLAVAAPWYFLMHKAHGKEFIDVFFGFHNVTRFLEPEHTVGDVFYYYIPIVIFGFLPWSIFLPLGTWQGFREKEPRIKKANLFLLIWIFVIFIFFSLSRSKLPTYIFPLFPALAVSVGRLWDALLDKGLSKKQDIVLNISLFLLLGLLVASAIGLYVVAKLKYPTVINISLETAIICIVSMSAFCALMLKRKYMIGITVFMASFAILVLPLSYSILPEIGRYESSKEISAELAKVIKPSDKVGGETDYARGIAFYTGREDVIDVHPHDVLIKLLVKRERAWCVIKEKNHIQLYTNTKAPYRQPTYVVYKFGKKVIITNKVPPDGKFLKKRDMNEYR